MKLGADDGGFLMNIRSEHGASAVEFAIVLPLLLVLVFGIIEFSIFLFDKAVITNASREGARKGVLFYFRDFDGDGENENYPLSDTEIRDIVKAYANSHLINLGGGQNDLVDGDIVITPVEPRATDDNLRVDVTFAYDFLVFPDLSQLLGGNFSDTITLRGVTTMRVE